MKFLKGLTLTLMLAGSAAQADMPATHGMLVFGNKVTYASHLPMFHHPHDYQVVMKIGFVPSHSNVLADYEALKAKGETLFTIAPETMDLTLVMSGAKKSFKAQLFQGHFERGGKLLGNVTVKVEKFILNNKLDPAAKETHEYSLFGEQGEFFGVHVIKGKPGYDAVAAVKHPHTLTVPQCHGRVCPAPEEVLLTDSQLPVTVSYVPTTGTLLPMEGQFLGVVGSVLSEIVKVIYVEEAELAH